VARELGVSDNAVRPPTEAASRPVLHRVRHVTLDELDGGAGGTIGDSELYRILRHVEASIASPALALRCQLTIGVDSQAVRREPDSLPRVVVVAAVFALVAVSAFNLPRQTFPFMRHVVFAFVSA